MTKNTATIKPLDYLLHTLTHTHTNTLKHTLYTPEKTAISKGWNLNIKKLDYLDHTHSHTPTHTHTSHMKDEGSLTNHLKRLVPKDEAARLP